MTYFQNLNRLILKELEIRADDFAAAYDPDKPSIILIPGGMGSRLLQCHAAYDGPGFPDNPAFTEIWLSWPAILLGKIGALELDADEWDMDQKPIIASGEMNSIVKSYDGTEAYFIDSGFNYTEFGYDWRRDVRASAAYLKAFLTMVRQKAMAASGDGRNPLENLTLFAHSMGGLVVKLFLEGLVTENERSNRWFSRFVSVASPFYGTETQVYRYYRGEHMVNLIMGSAAKVAKMVATLPGPYGLLPCPMTILNPLLDDLNLNRYPVRDAGHSQTPVDPFSDEGLDRFPATMDRTYMNRALEMFTHVGKPLPPDYYDKIFHIRNTIRDSDQTLEWHWQSIDTGTFQPGDPSPIWSNQGASDGTVPFWSARLVGTPETHVHDLAIGTDHGTLAEDHRVLVLVKQIARESAGLPPLPDASTRDAGAEPLSVPGDAAELSALVGDIAGGLVDDNHIDALSPSMRRAVVNGLSICG